MSDLFGDHHFVFGSDHPYVPIEATAGGLQALALDPAVLDAIATRTAHTLLHPTLPPNRAISATGDNDPG